MFPASLNSLRDVPPQAMQPVKEEVNVFEESWKQHNIANFNQLYPQQVDLGGEFASLPNSHRSNIVWQQHTACLTFRISRIFHPMQLYHNHNRSLALCTPSHVAKQPHNRTASRRHTQIVEAGEVLTSPAITAAPLRSRASHLTTSTMWKSRH